MHISFIADKFMPNTTRQAIGKYRHQVFVKELQWELPAAGEIEQDEFDVESAVHVLARGEHGGLVGYARLLPTTQSYLLATHFPQLVDGGKPVRSPFVWELSRYAASDVSCSAATRSLQMQTRVGKRLLLEATRYVESQGGHQIVFCTTLAIERLAQRWGVDIERLGPAQHDGSEWLVGARIHCNPRTRAALSERRTHAPAHAPTFTASPNHALPALA